MNGSLFTERLQLNAFKELPDESSVQTMRKRAGPRVAFGALVENGYIKPGLRFLIKASMVGYCETMDHFH